jgi:hypothetical protein
MPPEQAYGLLNVFDKFGNFSAHGVTLVICNGRSIEAAAV